MCRLKICIVSDSHDRREPLAAAVSEAKALGVWAVLHGGNPVAPSTRKDERRRSWLLGDAPVGLESPGWQPPDWG